MTKSPALYIKTLTEVLQARIPRAKQVVTNIWNNIYVQVKQQQNEDFPLFQSINQTCTALISLAGPGSVAVNHCNN